MANMTVLTQHAVEKFGFVNNGQSADCSTAQTLVPAVAGKICAVIEGFTE